METSSSSSPLPLWMRGVALSVVVILFQVFVAHTSVEKETKRRFQHALTGHALVQISYILPQSLCLALLALGAGAIYIFRTFFFEAFQKAVGPLLRPEEISGRQLPGAFYFLIGTGLTVWLVDDWTISRYAVECLAFADPMASWIGSTIPSVKVNAGTSLSGCVACFCTAWVVGWMMLDESILRSNRGDESDMGKHPYGLFVAITIGAVACTIAEGIPFGNDNLNIPLLTALAVDRLGR